MKFYGQLHSIFLNLTARTRKQVTFDCYRIMSQKAPSKGPPDEEHARKGADLDGNVVESNTETKKRKFDGVERIERLSDKAKVEVQVLDTPVKSESDQKEYRVIKLPNGLTALLISDTSGNLDDEVYGNEEETENDSNNESSSAVLDKEDDSEESEESDCESEEEEEVKKKDSDSEKLAACSLTIKVGSFSDPPEIPGLAHFLEHMVFMGSEKYPKENELEAYLNKKGGHDNAWTDCTTTNLYFEVHEKYLKGGLDRFSQFFIKPLMMRDAISREREAVDSEFQLNRLNDDARKEEILSKLAKENHPVRIFRWGNQVSLKDGVSEDKLYEELHKFRKRHYSANRMSLTIQARLSLDVLQDLVVEHFVEIPNNNLPPNDFSEFIGPEAYYSPSFHKIIKIESVKDIRKMQFTWVLPPSLHLYKVKPLSYVTYILAYEGRGSLLSYLRKKKWCLDLVCYDASDLYANNMYTMLIMYVTLTKEGFERVQEICDEVFSYINLLKQAGPQERIFRELQQIEDMSFRFQTEQSSLDNVEQLSDNMQYFEPKDYIRGDLLYFEYNPDELRKFVDAIDPSKVNIMIEKKYFEDETIDQVEPWFGTRYKEVDIPKDWVDRWRKIEPKPDYFLPEPNIFITEDFSLIPLPENVPKYPSKVYSDDKCEVWFRMDPKFRLPDACIRIMLITPLINQSAENSIMTDLYVKTMNFLLAEKLYPATAARLAYKFTYTKKGLKLEFFGFNEKIPLLLKTVIEYINSFSSIVKEDIYMVIKEREIRCYYNQFVKPKNLTKDTRFKILLKTNWTPVEKYAAIQNISFDQFKNFVKEITGELYMKFLAQGNLTESYAVDLAKSCVELLNFKPLPKEKQPYSEVVELPPGESCCKIKNMDINDKNSIVMNYYQSGEATLKGIAIIELITMIMEEPLFNQLRTKEQLGYDVYVMSGDTFGVLSLVIAVNTQADKFTTTTVNERIESFIEAFKKDLSEMEQKEFDNIKDSLIKLKRTADNELKDEFKRNWDEIEADKYAFDHREQDIEVLKDISLQEVIDWFNEHTKGGENYKKLSLHTIGSKAEDKSENTADEAKQCGVYNVKYMLPTEEEMRLTSNVRYINDINQFKNPLKIFRKDINPYKKTMEN